EPVSEEELDKARNYVALRFPAGFETSRNLAQKLEGLIVYDLPDDTFETLVSRVTSVTSADLQRVAAAHIQPEPMAAVGVGARKVIAQGTGPLGRGPMRVVPVAEFFK